MTARVVLAVGAVALVTSALAVPRSNATPAQAAPFTPGSGDASGAAIGAAVGFGSATIGVRVGTSDAHFSDQSGKAQALTLDLGFLGSASTMEICGGSGLALPLPEATVASTDYSGGKPVSAQQDAGYSIETASAKPGAVGEGHDHLGAITIPGLLTMTGGSVDTEASVDHTKQVRTVTADVRIGDLSLLGGAVQLRGLAWHLEQTVSGPDDRSDHRTHVATFSLGRLVVGPTSVPAPSADQAKAVFAALNKVLGLLGISLEAPAVSSISGGIGYAVSPLVVRVSQPALLAPVLTALFENDRFNDALNRTISAMQKGLFDPHDCNELGGLLKGVPALNRPYNSIGGNFSVLAAAALSVPGGQGSVALSLGGVGTQIDDTYYPAPAIGDAQIVNGTNVGSSGGGAVPSVGGPSGGAGLDTGGRDTPAAPSAPTGTSPNLQTTASTRPTRCETTSPAGWPMCWKGHGSVAAGVVGGVTLAVLAADEVYRRRRAARSKRSAALLEALR